MEKLSQKSRLIIWTIYLLALFGISFFLYQAIIPPSTELGLWFYSCLASIVLGELITSPYFTSPADSISNTVSAIISLLATNAWALNLDTSNKTIWAISLCFNIAILLMSLILIVTKNSARKFFASLSRILYIIISSLGNHRVVFSTVIFYAIIAFHIQKPIESLTISIAWVLLIAIHPIEMIWVIFKKIFSLNNNQLSDPIGEIAGYDYPYLLLMKNPSDKKISFGNSVIAFGDNGKFILGSVLDQIGFTGDLWHRVLRFDERFQPSKAEISKNPYNSRFIYDYEISENSTSDLAQQISHIKKDLIGLVASDSCLQKLKVELVRSDRNIQEGMLINVSINNRDVLYQIINGITKEELIEAQNSRRFINAEARKLGIWDGSNFLPIKWIPLPNSPVFIVEEKVTDLDIDSFGFIPKTNFHITMDLNSLVTHNTAILGILGVGKTCVALELIERLISERIKVICLDITDQYMRDLGPFINIGDYTREILDINSSASVGKTNFQPNVEEGGNIKQFIITMKKILYDFLRNENSYLKIINPSAFIVWTQDGKIFSGIAPMASLTPCEITRIITEAVLEISQEMGMTDKARCCLVFEEAHSLVPEWTSISSDGDKSATNGTAKAILQGRKYGLGCLLITQRTANVTKSILNQCNTVIALRTFDSTGIDFLGTFIGDDYANVLNDLDDRYAIIFGKASSCKTPIMVQVNDRDTFLGIFRPTVLNMLQERNDSQDNTNIQSEDELPF